MGLTHSWSEFVLFLFALGLFLAAGGLTTALAITGLKRQFSEVQSNPLEFSCLEWILACVLAGLVVTSWVLLLTAELGVFRIRYWISLLLIYDLCLTGLLFHFKRKRGLTDFSWRVSWHRADVLIFLCAGAAFLVLNRPAEYVLTNRDPGEYVSIALRLADSGTLRIKDPDFVQFNTPAKEALFLSNPLREAPYPEILPGFYLLDPNQGILLPQFLSLFPLWLAVSFKLWRFGGLFGFNILCGVLGILLMIPLGQWLLGSRKAGFAASLLMMVNPAQLWISRSPFTEMLAQVLLLGGLWFLAMGMKKRVAGLISMAALLFGLSLFVRIDSYLLGIAAVIFWGGWLLLRPGATDQNQAEWQKGLNRFSIWFGVCAAYSLLHHSIFAFPYVRNVVSVLRPSFVAISALTILAGVAVVLAAVGSKVGQGYLRSIRITERLSVIKRLTMVLLLIAVAYGLFLRPYLPSAREIVDLPLPHEGQISLSNELNLIRLGWYLSPLGLGLALLGFLVLLNDLFDSRQRMLLPFFVIFVVFSGFYLFKSRAFPDNYWVIRRYIEITIPGCVLLILIALNWLSQALERRVRRRAATAFCGLLLVLVWAGEFQAVPGLWHQTELEGTLNQLGRLGSILKESDVILLPYGNTQDFLTGPLKSVFHKTVYNLASFEPGTKVFEELVGQWLGEGKRVFIAAGDDQTRMHSSRLAFVPRDRFYFQTPFMERQYDRLPRAMESLENLITVYEVRRRPPSGKSEPVTFDMDFHFGTKTKGFYPSEAGGESIRWSSAEASIELPGVPLTGEATLLLSARQMHPEGTSKGQVKLFLNDQFLGQSSFSPEPGIYRFSVPPGVLRETQTNTLRFLSDTFSPVALGISTDIRDLGFILDYLKLVTAAPAPRAENLFVDLGSASDIHQGILEGFYERVSGAYRWTAPRAILTLVPPVIPGAGKVLRIRAVKSCPEQQLRQFLTVTLNGTSLGEQELVGSGDQFKVYEFPIPSSLATHGIEQIGIVVEPAWNPQKSGRAADQRNLGCAIDWIKMD
ncbi:MAG: hypothetical protein U0V70_07400 [Terriglobia bacterium]